MKDVPDGCHYSLSVFDLSASPGGGAYRVFIYSVVADDAARCLYVCVFRNHFLSMSDQSAEREWQRTNQEVWQIVRARSRCQTPINCLKSLRLAKAFSEKHWFPAIALGFSNFEAHEDPRCLVSYLQMSARWRLNSEETHILQ